MKKTWTRFLFTCLLVTVLSFSLIGSAFADGSPNQGNVPLEKARQVLEEKLIGLPGIAGIAHSVESGEIVVFLENEHAKGQVPDRFDGFPVRTTISGKFYARTIGVAEPVAPGLEEAVSNTRVSAVRPLVGGVSVSAYVAGQGWAGTLGMVTYDNKLLTNTHVIALDLSNNFLTAGTPVIQQGSYDGGTLTNRVGGLEKYIPIVFGRTRNYADAAIATIDSGITATMGTQFNESDNYQITGTTTVAALDYVRKSGRTSGVTESLVYMTNASVTVNYGGGKSAYFADQIVILQPFSEAGDSGSAVDKGGKFVGLVFAGSDFYSIVCKASHIIDGLGIAVEPTVPPTLTSITVTPASASIAVVSTQQFTATGTYNNGTSTDLTSVATWSSSNQEVATITSGLAAGQSTGTTIITAAYNGFDDTADLTVTTTLTSTSVNIEMTSGSRIKGKNTFGWMVATVNVMSGGSALESATVEGHWEAPTYLVVSGTTGADGKVSFQSSSIKNPTGTTFTFVVDKISKGGINYVLTGETSDSITW